jgi:sulfur carrier protein
VTTIALRVNGEAISLSPGSTVADVVARITGQPAPKGLAVAVDRAVIPRSEWSTTVLENGAALEIVTAAAGG